MALTWANITDVIAAGEDTQHALAFALGCDASDLTELLAEMTDKGLLVRWNDEGATRYRVPGERRAAP
jgi:DNA-binding MarR family transcriptional regulator